MLKTNLAYENWASKYRYGEESPLQTWERVARALANTEKNPEEWYPKFLKTLVNFDETGEPIGLKCTPGGRITANIGTGFKGATLLNCFINGPVSRAYIHYDRKTVDGLISYPIDINTPESPDDLINIFLTIMEQAKTLSSEGGYGINFDWIRPRGSLIKGTGIKHPGVVAYMKVWDAVAECIVKGDNDGYKDQLRNYLKSEDEVQQIKETVKKMTRKGAMLAALSVSHADVEEFVKAKQKPGVLTKFNISVLIDSAFMKAVESDDLYDQKFNGVVVKKVKARALYDLIMESTYNRAEPGVLFYENLQANNPISFLGGLNCANPCLQGDSLLLTKQYGFKKIEDLCGKEVEIWNGTEWSLSTIFFTGIKSVYETKMSNGMYLKSTQDHRVDCEGTDTEIQKTLGKTITRISGSTWGGIPTELTDIELICLGFSFGDANFHKASNRYKYVYIGENDTEIEELFKTLGEELPLEGRYDKRCLSPLFSDKCKLLDFPKVKLSERALSDKILSLPTNQLKLFLKGLYSANGSVLEKHNRIMLKSTCRELINQVQIILMGLGIKSYVTTNASKNIKFSNGTYTCKKSYDLNITSTDVSTFKNTIGFVQNYKINKINNIAVSSTGRRVDPTVVTISYIGEEKVYDFTEPKTHWGFVNGLKVHNCGEVGGNPALTTVCLLGSPNLTQYVEIIDGKPTFNWEKYKEDIKVFTRMLDNVCDLSNAPLPSYEWAIKNIRQFGMGINGLGSTLMMLGIKYNSKEALAFTKEICSIKENLTWQTSALLAKEKGVFPAYNKEKFENTEYFKSDRITKETKDMLRKYGARNGKTTTCPPAGTTAIICDNTSNGIEPVFMLEYERKTSVFSWPDGLNTDNVKNVLKYCKKKDFEYWEGEYSGKKYYYEPHNRGLCEVTVIRDYGYQWLLDNFPNKDHSEYLSTTKDLTVNDHLDVQEIVQYYNNQSTSKTVNLPSKYPFSDFKKLYIDGWKRGLVGLTTYREGSMESVLSSIENASENKEIIKRDIKLPSEFINGPTKVVKKEGMKFYIHLSYLPDDTKMKHPVCIWIYTNSEEKGASVVCNKASRELAKLALKCGIDQKLIGSAIEKCKNDYPHNRLGRMISLCLRHNVPRADILVSLKGIEGDHISSLLTVVRKFIGETIENGTALKGVTCPNCGSDNIVMQAGCFSCKDCESIGCG